MSEIDLIDDESLPGMQTTSGDIMKLIQMNLQEMPQPKRHRYLKLFLWIVQHRRDYFSFTTKITPDNLKIRTSWNVKPLDETEEVKEIHTKTIK